MSFNLQKIGDVEVFCPYKPDCIDIGHATAYPRVIELRAQSEHNHELLATFEHDAGDISFPIYRSADSGKTWEEVGRVHDTRNHWGMRFQPHLFELQYACAGLPKGTLLCAGLSVPFDMSQTEILIYKSNDCGKTWEFYSAPDIGGAAVEDNFRAENLPIWEPCLYAADNKLVCIFTDERRHKEGYAQNVSLRYTTDGVTWSELIDVVRKKTLTFFNDEGWAGQREIDLLLRVGFTRYGMPVATKMKNGQYICVYEVVSASEGGQIYYKISDDGIHYGDPEEHGTQIVANIGMLPQGWYSMPYVTVREKDGAIVVGAQRDTSKFTGIRSPGYLAVSYDNGKTWGRLIQPIVYDMSYRVCGWSMGMTFFDNDSKFIQLSPIPCKERNRNGTAYYDIWAGISKVVEK